VSFHDEEFSRLAQGLCGLGENVRRLAEEGRRPVGSGLPRSGRPTDRASVLSEVVGTIEQLEHDLGSLVDKPTLRLLRRRVEALR
jgi:hypothetical protein